MGSYAAAIMKEGKRLYKDTKPYRVTVPIGRQGTWEIQHFTTDLGFEYARLDRDGRAPGLGKFTRLLHHKGTFPTTVMSDTAAEIQDLRPYLSLLRGNVLITGLGLGMVVQALVKIPRYSEYVKSVTVIEQSVDVMKLSATHYLKMDKRVKIVNADAYLWRPEKKGKQFDAAWHDVWNTISSNNDFGRMRKHYAPYMTQSDSQYCWGEDEANAMERLYG